jgi:hypothetical protein
LKKNKLDCIKQVILSIKDKETFDQCFKGPLYIIIHSNNTDKINYFFNFQADNFLQPILKYEEENQRMEWIYSRNDLEGVQEALHLAADCFRFNFLQYVFERCTERIISQSYFNSIIRYIVYASLGYTNCYYGLFGKPGNPSIYKKFYEMEIWNYAKGDQEDNKKAMIELFVSYLPSYVKTGGIYELDMRDKWWRTFFEEHCPKLYPKIDWSLFVTPEVDLEIKLNSAE